jgi:hypothetical protein
MNALPSGNVVRSGHSSEDAIAAPGIMTTCAAPLVYLAMVNLFSVLRLRSVGERGKDADILAARNQLTVL